MNEMSDKIKSYIALNNLDESEEEFKSKIKNWKLEILNNSSFEEELKFHKALANQERLLIYKLLLNRPICTCVLSFILGKSQSTISRHLKIIEDAGLIIGKKEGYFVHYYTREMFAQDFSFNI